MTIAHQTRARHRQITLATMLTAAGALVISALGAAAPASADDTFVAISYSEESHVWGWGSDYPTLDGARIRSLSECQSHGGNHCEFIAWAENSCAALAVDGNKFYGWYGATIADAKREALARNGGGRIAVSRCSS